MDMSLVSKSVAKTIAKTGGVREFSHIAGAAGMAAYAYHKGIKKDETQVQAGIEALGVGAAMSVLNPYSAIIGSAVTWGINKIDDVASMVNSEARDMSKGDRPFAGVSFHDNDASFTMRQAGMASIEQAKYDMQNSMIGREAQYYK